MCFTPGSQCSLSLPVFPEEEKAGEGGEWALVPGHCPQLQGARTPAFISGPSGSGRLRWAWSCWPRQGITRHCRGCFRRLISTTQACWAAWTVLPPRRPPPPCTAACTGLLLHPIPSCSGPWCPECSSTAWGLGDSRPSIPCPTPSQAPRIPGEEQVTVPPCPLPDPDSCPSSPGTRLSGLPCSQPGSKEVREEDTHQRVEGGPSTLHLPTPRDRAGKLPHRSVTGENADSTQSATSK